MYQYKKFHTEENVFIIRDTLPESHGATAKVILLAGQSNATGCTFNQYLKSNVTPEKYNEYQSGYDNLYINHFTGNNASYGFVKTSTTQGEFEACFGPEVGMAETLHEMYPNELIFIIKCSWSGSNLYQQWLSPSSGHPGIFYQDFVRYVEQNLNYLKSKGYQPQIQAMCWMQGESDTIYEDTATKYADNLANFIQDLRNHFSTVSIHDGFAFIDATIASGTVWPHDTLVNTGKQTVANLANNNVLIDTNTAGLTCTQEPINNPNMAHYDSLSQIELGHLFAEQIAQFFHN